MRPKCSTACCAAATTDAITEPFNTAIQTGCDLALKGFEAHRQLAEAVFSSFAGQPDPFEMRTRTKGFLDGLLGIAETGVSESTAVMRGYVNGLAATGMTEGGTPRDFAEVGTRIERTARELTGLNRTATEQVVEMTTRQAKGFEALVRWQHPLFKAISPEKIVEIAQAEGKGPALLKYVLGYAAEHAQRWPNGGFVSVNINSADLQRSNMADCVRKILDRAGLSANRLWLEVTDSEILRNSETVQANLTTLREAGVQIAIDDFGTGYSSLSHLGMYPSDIVKIDRSLVGNCDTIDSNKIIINATRALASVNGFRVVAEGVETKEEISALQNANFEMAQGYAFHRPMSQRRILELLNKQVQETSNELPGGIEVA